MAASTRRGLDSAVGKLPVLVFLRSAAAGRASHQARTAAAGNARALTSVNLDQIAAVNGCVVRTGGPATALAPVRPAAFQSGELLRKHHPGDAQHQPSQPGGSFRVWRQASPRAGDRLARRSRPARNSFPAPKFLSIRRDARNVCRTPVVPPSPVDSDPALRWSFALQNGGKARHVGGSCKSSQKPYKMMLVGPKAVSVDVISFLRSTEVVS
jgi:hypothetical protein